MPTTVITSAEQATPEWLTAALSTSGALSAGKVIAVELDARHRNWSTNARLRPRYSADAAGDRPTSLFLKMVRTHLDDDESFSDSEVLYYTRDYVDVPDAPLVRCHDAAHSTDDHAYHLLLDDVTATHVEATRRPPTLEYALALADGLAAIHARWWGADRLATANQPIHDAAHVQRFVDLPPAHAHRMRRPRLLRTLVNACASAERRVSTAAKYSSNRAAQRVLDCAPVTVPTPMRSTDASARSSGRKGRRVKSCHPYQWIAWSDTH